MDGWNFFATQSIPKTTWPQWLDTKLFSPPRLDYKHGTLRSRSPSQTHLWRRQQSQRDLRLAGWSGVMSITQLFKPWLFTDNLLTIQLFILRQRPSPSHTQMKSNKALLPNDTVETERHSPLTLCCKDKYICSTSVISWHKIKTWVEVCKMTFYGNVSVTLQKISHPLMLSASSLFVSASY